MIKKKKRNVFQYELNKAYENINFQTAYYLAYAYKVVAVALFYMPIVPIGMLLAPIQLIFLYFTWKYIFIRRSKIPEDLNY